MRAICCSIGNIALADEIRQKRGMGGKNLLLICRCCFDKNIEILSSWECANVKQKKDQLQHAKKRKEAEQVKRGNRKGKKSK